MSWLSNLFKSKPKPHGHVFGNNCVMVTGNKNTVSTNKDKKFYGQSYVHQCTCGQLAVMHSGGDEWILLS